MELRNRIRVKRVFHFEAMIEQNAFEEEEEEDTLSQMGITQLIDATINDARDNKLVRKLYVHKAILATKMEVFQLHSSRLLDDGDRFFQVLDQMSRSLNTRLTSALMNNELATKRKQENEAFAEAALACEKIQMNKVEQEVKSLKQVVEISKLLEFLIDGGQVLDTLHVQEHYNLAEVHQVVFFRTV